MKYPRKIRFPAALLLAAPQLAPAADTGVDTGGIGPLLIVAACLLVVATLLVRHAGPCLARLRLRQGRRRLARATSAARLPSLERCILPGIGDGLTRIDCAVLTSAGIICIRAIHGNGTVFGQRDEPQWTRVDGVERHRFLNPVIQNEGRVQALRRAAPGIPVVNAVVFTGRVRFAGRAPAEALPVSKLATWLEEYASANPSAADPEAAWLSLRSVAMTDEAAQRDFDAQLSFG